MEVQTGIYKITNLINNKIYIGSSINIKNRIELRKYEKANVITLKEKREGKRLIRKGKLKVYKLKQVVLDKLKSFHDRRDLKIFLAIKSDIFHFLSLKGFFDESIPTSSRIIIPPIFSLIENYNSSIFVMKQIMKVLFTKINSELEIDFSKCNFADIPSLHCINALIYEFSEHLKRVNYKCSIRNFTFSTKIIKSSIDNVNNNLVACGFIDVTNVVNCDMKLEAGLVFFTGDKYKK